MAGICLCVCVSAYFVVSIREPLNQELMHGINLDHFAMCQYNIDDKNRSLLHYRNITYTYMHVYLSNNFNF